MRVRDRPGPSSAASESQPPSTPAMEGGEGRIAIPYIFSQEDNTNGTSQSSLNSSAASLLSGVDLLYQLHCYVRSLERTHASCEMTHFALKSQLATEKETSGKLASKVAFLERRVLMLEAALKGSSDPAVKNKPDLLQ